uniref:Translocation protein SEC62 n=1 Tax=Glossina brevipalpis TaxID=37001 RepID=A0A1A9X5M3_9MUSC
MSEKKKSRRRKDEYQSPGEQIEKPTKEEIKVAKWMKKNVKTKKTKLMNHDVEYFTSSKAIDALLKSKFAEGYAPSFTAREDVVAFLDTMLVHKFFHRAQKVPINVDEIRHSGAGDNGKLSKKADKGNEKKEEGKEKSSKSKKSKDDKKSNETKAEANGSNGVTDEAGGKSSNSVEKKEKRKRKIRLDMHPDQIFVDGSEAYVWIYDPIPVHYWIYGLIVLLGAIGVCLFPLWPPVLRKGVYYLSLLAAGFLVFILVLTVIRLIIFTIVWALTGGKLRFWIFPNLTEDVGFFASFWPLYESNYINDNDSTKSHKKTKKSKKKSKDSDLEDNEDSCPEAVPLEADKIDEIKEHDADLELRLRTMGVSSAQKLPDSEESHSSSSSATEFNNETELKE